VNWTLVVFVVAVVVRYFVVVADAEPPEGLIVMSIVTAVATAEENLENVVDLPQYQPPLIPLLPESGVFSSSELVHDQL
jgi:hypothetical protein